MSLSEAAPKTAARGTYIFTKSLHSLTVQSLDKITRMGILSHAMNRRPAPLPPINSSYKGQ